MQEKETTNRRRCDEEFKRRAVEMIESGERSSRQLSKDLGVSEWRLCQWKKHYRKIASGGGPTGGGGTAPEATGALDPITEVRRLRRELETVSRQRDILKKACSILGQEEWNASR